MTRVAVLADIHGNLPALEAVLEDLAQFEVDRMIVAGDIVNWGPFSREVVERLAGIDCAILRGNNEFYLLDYNTRRAPPEWSNATDWSLLPWLRRQLAGRPHLAIATWPDALSLRFPDAPSVRVVHGSPRSNAESMFPSADAAELVPMVESVTEDFLICAHTHLRMNRQVGRWRIFNPGSVGVPLDGHPGASYMLLDGDEEGWRATFRRVPFDLQTVFDEFERQRFVEECGVVGHLVVEEFRTARLCLYPFLKWRQAHHPDAPLSFDLLSEFSTVDIWQYTIPAYNINR